MNRNKNSGETRLPLHRHNALLQYFERLAALSSPTPSVPDLDTPTSQAPPPLGTITPSPCSTTATTSSVPVGSSLCNGSRESLASNENYDNDAWLSQVILEFYFMIIRNDIYSLQSKR